MDDLSSLDWNGSKASPSGQQPSGPKGNYFPTLRPTPPVSGRSTPNPALLSSPAQKPATTVLTGSRGSTPVNDSFANLVSFDVSQSAKTLSLQEQQQKIQEEKAIQEAERRKAFDSRFGVPASGISSWSSLGNGQTTPSSLNSPSTSTTTGEYQNNSLKLVDQQKFSKISPTISPQNSTPTQDNEGDILAAFNASAPVDRSSHMPLPPKDNSYSSNLNRSSPHAASFDTDDDPFGLGMGPSNGVKSDPSPSIGEGAPSGHGDDDDDVLGMLSRPVSEFPKPVSTEKSASSSPAEKPSNPKVKALNELVDMGFEPAKCRMALDSTESGTDVQAAVGWLLNQAHKESRNKQKPSSNGESSESVKNPRQTKSAPNRRTSSGTSTSKPAWMKEQGSGQRRQDNGNSATGEKDAAQYASDLGSSLFKTANSLWKTGQKKLNQAVSELNSADNADPNQPKWMREASQETSMPRPRQQQDVPTKPSRDPKPTSSKREQRTEQANVTDEALLLEAGGGPPSRKKAIIRTEPEPARESRDSRRPENMSKTSAPRVDAHPQPKFLQQTGRDPRAKLSRQAVEEEASVAYISPARRKKTVPKSQITDSEPDLLLNDGGSKISTSPHIAHKPTSAPPRSQPALPKTIPVRPAPPMRTIPPISSIAMQSSTTSRKAGTEAFKRGDYGFATLEYTKALTAIPPSHPLTIVILSNRALSHSKTGDPKASIADATSVIDLVGPSRGIGETIDLGDGEGAKAMDTYWGKAMLRKAEGLEHLERWADAAAVWRSCAEAGVGGATSIAGRNRCESAARPKPPSAAKKAPPRPKPSALSDLGPSSSQSAEAVTRLRAANAAADKLDDEKFRLADIVDDRVSRWRAGKEANLRALLASLENVLWDDAGWKKTGMAELIQPNKVKIVYMRGIGKVHPDKLPTTATTEQKMISAAVFATLNEAWEKFKTENHL